MVEAVPHQDGRFGIHRCLLDCSVRAAGSGGLRGLPGGTGNCRVAVCAPKTDVLDAQWIQRLHSYGLLRASFRPPHSVLAACLLAAAADAGALTPPVMPSICKRPWSKSMSN